MVESLGRVWLFTVAEAGWRPPHGERVAEIGPLAVDHSASYTAVYLGTILNPGTTAAVDRHAGPEAFYVLAGDTCLETPSGLTVRQGPGHSLIRARRSPDVADGVRQRASSRTSPYPPRFFSASDNNGARGRMDTSRIV